MEGLRAQHASLNAPLEESPVGELHDGTRVTMADLRILDTLHSSQSVLTTPLTSCALHSAEL